MESEKMVKCPNCERNVEEWEKEEDYDSVYRCHECKELIYDEDIIL